MSAKECVACYYDSNWWVGLVQNINFDEKDFEISFLHPLVPSNSFTWPRLPYMNVMRKIRPSTTLTGQTYYLEKKSYVTGQTYYVEKKSYEMISKLPN